mgnify:CR=1 FL=1
MEKIGRERTAPERPGPEQPASDPPGDAFTLWDLRVEVVEGPGPMVCNHSPGDYFELSGENLRFPDGQSFPLYPLAAILPLLPLGLLTTGEFRCPQ